MSCKAGLCGNETASYLVTVLSFLAFKGKLYEGDSIFFFFRDDDYYRWPAVYARYWLWRTAETRRQQLSWFTELNRQFGRNARSRKVMGSFDSSPIYGNSVERIPREIEGHPLTELWFSVAHFR